MFYLQMSRTSRHYSETATTDALHHSSLPGQLFILQLQVSEKTVFSVKVHHINKFLFPRIFGEEISSLKVVSACNCGIADFSGVDFLVNLKELYVANNAVENVFELSDLLNIEVVDLEG